MSKDKTIKLTEKEIELLKRAVKNEKVFTRLKASYNRGEAKENAIAEIYHYETIEKKLEQ